MREFECRPVYEATTETPRWQVIVSEDGGEWLPLEPFQIYDSEGECEAALVRLEAAERGEGAANPWP